MNKTSFPDPRRDRAFDRYIAEVIRYPVLTREREKELAERYRDNGDLKAAHELVVSNLRFVVKISRQYRGYGVKMLDLIQEGNVGLMLAVRKFDPAKGFRLISYAVWWIRAALNAFVMRSWSLVKLGTTQIQRRLFFRLHSERSLADRDTLGDVQASTDLMVGRFGVPEKAIATMEGRLGGRDISLDAQVHDGALESRTQVTGWDVPSPEDLVDEHERATMVRAEVAATMATLSVRERYIVEHRLMTSAPQTLQQLASRFGISRERARQLELRVKGKISTSLGALARTA